MWPFAIGLNAVAFGSAWLAGLSATDLQPCLVLPAMCLLIAAVMRCCATSRVAGAHLFSVLGFISLVKIPFVVLSYAGASLAMPVWDATLLRIDRSLGFAWPDLMHWLDTRPGLALVLFVAYKTIWFQLVAFVILGTFCGTRRDIDVLMTAVVIALGAAIAIGTACPALGILSMYPNEHFEVLRFTGGASPMPVAEALRSGRTHAIDLWHPEGLIVFPSFHAAMAIILIAAAQRRVLMAAVFTPLNLLMLASAYTEGGHYLCDLLAGAMIGAFAWCVASARIPGLERRSSRSVDLEPFRPAAVLPTS